MINNGVLKPLQVSSKMVTRDAQVSPVKGVDTAHLTDH